MDSYTLSLMKEIDTLVFSGKLLETDFYEFKSYVDSWLRAIEEQITSASMT